MKTASLIAFVILSPLVHADPHYQAINLGVLPGTTSCDAYALNNLNQMVGMCQNGQGFFWSQTTGMQSIDHFNPQAINDSGVVVGLSNSPTTGLRVAARWTAASGVQMLAGLPNTFGSGGANSINAWGSVAGTYTNSAGHGAAFLWSPDGTYQEIPLGDLDDAQAALVDDSGTVAGWGNQVTGGAIGFTWTPSSGVQTFQAVPGATSTFVNSIHNQTMVGVFRSDQQTGDQAFIMPLGGPGRQLEGQDCTAFGLNSSGQVVGYCGTFAGRAMLWQPDGTRLTIRTHLVNNIGLLLPLAFAINDSGAIVADVDAGRFQACYLLVPVP